MHCAANAGSPSWSTSGGQVNCRGLIADRAIRLAADEGQIGDVIRLAGSEAGLQYGFGKDVMELQAMLGARMIREMVRWLRQSFAPAARKARNMVLNSALR